MPMLRWCGGSCDSGLPSSRISPAVGVSKPASIISVVVLPEPDGPEQRQELAALDVEIEVVDDARDAVVGLADADEADDRTSAALMPRARQIAAAAGAHPATFHAQGVGWAIISLAGHAVNAGRSGRSTAALGEALFLHHRPGVVERLAEAREHLVDLALR